MDTERRFGEGLAASMAAFAERAQGTDSEQIATDAVTLWRDIHVALSPIIGARGVCALYQRSLHLARADFPWLGLVHATALDAGEFGALYKALSQQRSTVAAAAHNAVLAAFYGLLANLIGESLTERLLSVVWDRTSGGSAVQGLES